MQTEIQNDTCQSQAEPLLEALFPELVIRRIETESGITIHARFLTTESACPSCQTISTRVHSYYTRSPGDLPLSGLPVQLVLQVRRFRCTNRRCETAMFAERVPKVIAPYAQRTVRLTQTLTEVGLVLGGEAGARQSQRQGMPAARPHCCGLYAVAFPKWHLHPRS